MTERLTYLSVCSGIEAATVAWHPLGWTPFGFAEIEAFPSAVLAHHYGSNLPGEKWSGGNAPPNFGDMSKFSEWPDATIDLLVGGTPCQSYSVAGLRKGLDDPRGDLTLTYAAIARRYRPSWLVWENVPGVLSSDAGRSFASLLGLLTGRRVEVPVGGWQSAGIVEGYQGAYGVAWRVLDAQFVRVDGFGRAVPQRRRRVFVVGYSGDWRRAAAVLFERESLCGNPAPWRKPGEGFAADVAPSLVSSGRGVARSGETRGQDPVVAVRIAPPIAATLTRGAESSGKGGYAGRRQEDEVNLVADFDDEWRVRRLMPVECARLQGFPDLYTQIEWGGRAASACPDGPQYKCYGNSMAVPVMRWLGRRIEMVNAICRV